jgi:hypothetical protein
MMSAENVNRLRAAHESWKNRDFAGVVSNAAKGLAYTDHDRNTALNTRNSVITTNTPCRRNSGTSNHSLQAANF